MKVLLWSAGLLDTGFGKYPSWSFSECTLCAMPCFLSFEFVCPTPKVSCEHIILLLLGELTLRFVSLSSEFFWLNTDPDLDCPQILFRELLLEIFSLSRSFLIVTFLWEIWFSNLRESFKIAIWSTMSLSLLFVGRLLNSFLLDSWLLVFFLTISGSSNSCWLLSGHAGELTALLLLSFFLSFSCREYNFGLNTIAN